jgi:hypothetical protein
MLKAGLYRGACSAGDIRARTLRWVFFGAASAAIITILVLPSNFLDGGPTICIWCRLGLPWCPGCGMSRAVCRLLHGEFSDALSLNWRVLIVAPILAWLYCKTVYQCFRDVVRKPA